jgi:hypothetical protein
MGRFTGNPMEVRKPKLPAMHGKWPSFDRLVEPVTVQEINPDWNKNYLDRIAEPDEPGDYLENALLAFKPGTRTGKDVAATAMIMAGVMPPNPSGDLITVAQDLVDNDPRLEGEE